jgi:hypothetical protein
VILATETWFKDTKQIQLPNYKLYTTHRANRSGGGAAVYIKQDLPVSQLNKYTYNDDVTSATWVKVSSANAAPDIIFGCIYHPPNAIEGTSLEYLSKTITDILVKHPNCSLVLGGDFNILDCSILGDVFNLTNIVNFPTRVNSFLDKVYTNELSYKHAIVTKCSPLGRSDHACVVVSSCFLRKSEYKTIHKRTVTTTARNNIMLEIAKVDWSLLSNINDLDKLVESYQDIITTIYHKHCPIRHLRIKTDSKPAWETPLIQKLRRAKDKAFTQGKPTYTYLRQILEILISKAKQRYYDSKINHLKAGSTNWWRSIKSLDPTTKSDPQSNYIIDGDLCTPNQFACNLNSYYNNIAGVQPQPTVIIPPTSHKAEVISIGLVKLALKNINAGKAVHSQDYPPWITKNCAEDLCIPITIIVNKTLQQCKFPMLYKRAEITPIPKTRSAATCKDYRPISLLWHIGKVVETFICRTLRQQLTPKLEDNQYAYRQGVGCTDALVSVLDDVTKSLDDSKNIGMQLVLYDFSKAFDLMDHSILLSKLKSLDVSEESIALVAHYLQDRQHCVAIRQHNTTSTYLKNNVGVPQGTLCGPVLWLAFVNSLQFQHGTTIKYADDTTTIYPLAKEQTNTISNTKASVEFVVPNIGQELVNQCSDWAMANKMRLNTQKTKSLNISLRKELIMKSNLTIDGSDIENVTSSKLLGVTIDSHLTFSDHIAERRKSTNRKIHGLLVLKQSGVDQGSLIHMYKSQIIPTISHAAAAWFPFTTEQQRAEIEKCQKLALRIIYNETECYETRLELAQIPTLCTTLNEQCSTYMARLTTNHDHPLRSRMRIKQASRPKRSSSSQSDFYFTKTRTVKRSDFILANPKYSE